MATSTSNVGPVSSTPSVSSRASVARAGQGGQGGQGESDGSAGFVEAINAATPTRARTSDDHDDHAAMEDLWSGAERHRDALSGKTGDDRGPAEDAPRIVLTPYRITDSAVRSGAIGLRGLSPPVRSEIVRAVDVYDRAIRAVTSTHRHDLLGQRLDRRF